MTSRYLIAILPPSPAAEEIHGFKEYCREKYNSKASLNSPPHITMHMPFEWRSDHESELIASLTGFCREQKSFDLELNGFGAFEPRVIFVAVSENAALRICQSALQRHMKVHLNVFNANYKEEPFHPHVTIAFRDLKKSTFPLAWEEFKAREYQFSFVSSQLTVLRHDGRLWKPLVELPFHDK